MRALDPALPVVVSSGYSTGAVMANYRAHGFDDVLPKPWRGEGLGEVLRRVLATARDLDR